MEKSSLHNLKKEIKSELLKEEIREVIKKEFRNILFEERHFETQLTTYIKSLCYRDINYLQLLNRGLIKYGPTFHKNLELSSSILLKKKNVDLRKIHEEYTQGWSINCSFENFESGMNFSPIVDHNSNEEIIVWTEKARKKHTYKGLFDLYSEILKEEISNLDSYRKNWIFQYISVKFRFRKDNETTAIKISPKNIRKSFNYFYPKKPKNKSTY